MSLYLYISILLGSSTGGGEVQQPSRSITSYSEAIAIGSQGSSGALG